MYKDKDKERESGKERQRRYRENRKALHPAIVAGIERLTTNADGTVDVLDRTARTCTAIHYQRLYPDQPYKGIGIAPEDMPASPEPIRVSKPGDADYKYLYMDKIPEEIQDMINDVAENGGEYSFITIKGEVKDVHRTEPHE